MSSHSPNQGGCDRYRRLLEAQLERLRPSTAALEEQVRSQAGGASFGELSNAPMHLADGGSEQFRQELDATLLENEEYLTTEVREALERIASGTFGSCEHCGNRIAPERLHALPHARYCVRCAEELRAGCDANLNTGRPGVGHALVPEDGEPPAEQPLRADDEVPNSTEDEVVHAAETPGGGSARGGLAGTNAGRGDPDLRELQRAGGSGEFDVRAEAEEAGDRFPQSGATGGAVGGTPAGKRAARD
jgi:RNA polymerase-binding transcription factor DksA